MANSFGFMLLNLPVGSTVQWSVEQGVLCMALLPVKR